MPDHIDVFIAGAGPTGLALALALARQGIHVAIADLLPEPQKLSRAAVIHAGTLQALKPLDLTNALIEQGVAVPRVCIRDRDRPLLVGDFSCLPTDTPFALLLSQERTEGLLIERLAGLGVEVQRPVDVVDFDDRGDEIAVACRSGGAERTIHCRFLVAADGFQSSLRDKAQIAFPGKEYGSFLLADVRMGWAFGDAEVSLFFSGEGTLVVAPLGDGRYRIVAQKGDAPAAPELRDVEEVLLARGPGFTPAIQELLWSSRFRVHHRLADRYHKGRLVLLGDAAHVHSPAGGQGMNLGLRDAIALSDALIEALRRNERTSLEAYSRQRRAAAKDVLAMTDRLTRLATLRSPLGRQVRNMMIAAAAHSPQVCRFVALRLSGLEDRP